jgi:hypothetical protein
METERNQIGVYCLANDGVFEWFQAFVRSLRKFNPTLPLTVIPYNSSVARLKALQPQFNFSVMEESVANRFDGIAHRVAGQRLPGGTFRKLCCFFGGYETFIFLDSDIVVTSKLEPLLRKFETASGDFVYFDADIAMVYKTEFARQMVAEYGSAGFTSGSWMARRGSITESEIMTAVESGEKIRDEFSIWGEQPFFNYLFDVSRRVRLPIGALTPEISNIPWPNSIFRHDAVNDVYFDGARRPIPLLHWPGCEWPTMYRADVFLRYRTLGMNSGERWCYTLNFYYRRFRANLKERMKKSRWFTDWVARRDERRRRKHLQSTLKT